jgi:hypothetical protein
MKVKHLTAILILIFIGLLKSEAQELKSVSGIVTTFRKIPLNKVRVVAVKSREITYTDSVGRFTIQCFKNDVLTVSASGFSYKKIRIGGKIILSVDLLFKDNITNFNDAVNNGHIKEDALKTALNNDQLDKEKDYSRYLSIYELIENEFYNVSVRGTSVYNKKIRSFDLTPQVLYVVDGKIVSDISFVSPNHVKTIEFIDDVGSTLYGMQGANGVIKVTLK